MSEPDDEFAAADAAAAAQVTAELFARIGENAPRPRLEPTRRAVELLGDPHRSAPVIHLTGTNGKTSTARMIESLVRASGLRTGLLTSPHLVAINERIVVDGEPVSNEALARNWRDISGPLALVDAQLEAEGEQPLTYFEALTVLAFAVFADAPVDVVVLEVGMGGEWDSTNVADADVAVFTPIDLDHQARLGNTVAEIARTKAGIIKPGARAVSAIQSPEAFAELQRAAELDEASLVVERRDFAVESTVIAVGGQLVSIRGLAGEYSNVYLPLYGDHQAQNAAVAIAAVETFFGDGARALDPEIVALGLGQVTSPGRLQLIGRDPSVFVDAAHNPHGARALAAALSDYFATTEFAIVIAVLGDKDAHGILAELAPVAARLIVTTSTSDRARSTEELTAIAAQVAIPQEVISAADVATALDLAREWASAAPSRAVLVTGSITLVGDTIAIARAEGWA